MSCERFQLTTDVLKSLPVLSIAGNFVNIATALDNAAKSLFAIYLPGFSNFLASKRIEAVPPPGIAQDRFELDYSVSKAVCKTMLLLAH